MGNVVNLNKFRKAKERAAKTLLAEQNRRKHGRSASEKAAELAQRARLERELAGKRLETDE